MSIYTNHREAADWSARRRAPKGPGDPEPDRLRRLERRERRANQLLWQARQWAWVGQAGFWGALAGMLFQTFTGGPGWLVTLAVYLVLAWVAGGRR